MKNKKLKTRVALAMMLTIHLVLPGASNTQWVRQILPQNGGIILGLDFADSQRGAIGGWRFSEVDFEDRCYHTFDGGIQWILSETPDSLRSMLGIKFIDGATGIAVGTCYDVKQEKSSQVSPNHVSIADNLGRSGFPYYKGIVLNTFNGGLSWTTASSIPGGYTTIIDVDFINSQTGYICGDNQIINSFTPAVSRTSDGGLSWIQMNIPVFSGSLRRVLCQNDYVYCVGVKGHGLVSMDSISDGVLILSTNSGSSWTNIVFPNLHHISGISFINMNTGFICGVNDPTASNIPYSSSIYKTTDAGLSWMKYRNFDSSYFQGMETFKDPVILLVFGNGIIYDKILGNMFTNSFINRSSDNGNTWNSTIVLFENSFLLDCKFLTSTNIYINGGIARFVFPELHLDPVVLHTTNGGSVFVNSNSAVVPEEYNLSQNYPNPFNPITKLEFNISKSGLVRLRVFNSLGVEVRTLVNETKPSGRYTVSFDGSDLPSGVYFYTLEAGDFLQTKKMLLLK